MRDYFFPIRNKKGSISREDKQRYSCLHNAAKTMAEQSQDRVKAVGYEVLGPILYGYSLWLQEEVKREGAETIAFLSREGRILMRAYNTLFGEKCSANLVYLNVSRLALCKAMTVQTSCWKEFEVLYASLLKGNPSVRGLFQMLDLPMKAFKDADDNGILLDKSLDEIGNKDKLYDIIRDNGYECFEKQRELLELYLVQKGITSGKCVISDIGWAGTMQLYLSKLKENIRFIGCYLATFDVFDNKNYCTLDRRGFLFEAKDWNRDGRMIRFTQSAMESLFLGNEGTTTGYTLVNERVIPVKKMDSDCHSGLIEKVQNAAIQFVAKMRMTKLKISSALYFVPYINFAVFPDKFAIEFFRRFSFINGVGNKCLVPRNGIVYYVFHPNRLKADLEENCCKVIWLRGLVGVPLPYYHLLCILSGKLNMKSQFAKKYLA